LGWWLRHRLANQVKTRLRSFLRVLTLCSGSATAFGSALARSHGSDLLPLRLPFAHRSAVPFVASPTLWKVFTGLAQTPCPPRNERSFCPAFRRLSFGRLRSRGTARVARSVLDAVATIYPLGNCDSLRPETSRTYLTQLRAVSHRPSSPSPYFALLTARERRQRNW
jgi:hypothetical protein